MSTKKKSAKPVAASAPIKIEKGVKIPPVARSDGRIVKALIQMKKGDSVVVPNSQLSSWYTAAKRSKRAITARRVSDSSKRVWIS